MASIGCTFALFYATAAIPIGPVLMESKLGALITVCGAATALGAAAILPSGVTRNSPFDVRSGHVSSRADD